MDYLLKAQPSLRGWSAWVVGEIVRQRQQTVAEVTSRIIEDWIDSNYEYLSSRYNISLQDFETAAIQTLEAAAEEAAEEAAKKAEQAQERIKSFKKNPSLVEK